MNTYIYVGKLNKNGSTTFIKWREMIISGERSNRPKSQVSFAARGIGFLKKEKTLKEIPFSISNHKPTISCRLPNIVDVWSVQSLPGILYHQWAYSSNSGLRSAKNITWHSHSRPPEMLNLGTCMVTVGASQRLMAFFGTFFRVFQMILSPFSPWT